MNADATLTPFRIEAAAALEHGPARHGIAGGWLRGSRALADARRKRVKAEAEAR